MEALRELLTEQLQDILHAENQLVAALPKMANAAHNPKLKEAFAKHLAQTKGQVERLNTAFEILGEKAEPKPCKAMTGLVQEGEDTIEDGKKLDEGIADLALIMAAQKVEHYEIAAYGGVRCLARQIGEREVETLLAHTLGEEESSDYLLTAIAKPILQDATQSGPEANKKPAKSATKVSASRG